MTTSRYDSMIYRRCGRSGIQLPAVSLGLWQNFGGVDVYENSRAMLLRAFELGVTHFDLANNYGPPPGSAEEAFGQCLKHDLHPHRDELIISTKAGYIMWDGPYGRWGSRKHLLASLDQSLKRMSLDYVDIFYSHRPDPDTPIEETMSALDMVVRSGKAIYAGLSNYNPQQTAIAVKILRSLDTPCLIHQEKYSMLNRRAENGLIDVLREEGVGCIAFTPLAQGLLTDRYLKGIPTDSRVAKSDNPTLRGQDISEQVLAKIRALHGVAQERGQSLAQMALAWVLRDKVVCSVLIGASRVSQLEDNLAAIKNLEFDDAQLQTIEEILAIPS